MATLPNLQLTWELAKRDLTDRYAGNALGLAWLFIQPVAMVIIYLNVFTLVFKVRIPESVNASDSFPLFFLAGFVCWFSLSDAISRAPSIVSANAALVKQIVFPTEILPVKSALAVSLAQVIFVALVVAYSIRINGPDLFLLAIFIAVPLLFLFNVGIASLFGALGVFVKDVKDLVTLILTGGLFLTPVLFPPGTVQGGLAKVIAYNPLSYPVYCFQDVLFYQRIENPEAWIIFTALSLGLAFFGQLIFRAVKHLFGDAL